MRTGHYVGDPNAPFDPKSVVEADGLSQNQREYLHKERREIEQGKHLHWTSCYREGRWWTREEWLAREQPVQPGPTVQVFQEEWYPALNRRVSDRGELRRLMRERGLEHKY